MKQPVILTLILALSPAHGVMVVDELDDGFDAITYLASADTLFINTGRGGRQQLSVPTEFSEPGDVGWGRYNLRIVFTNQANGAQITYTAYQLGVFVTATNRKQLLLTNNGGTGWNSLPIEGKVLNPILPVRQGKICYSFRDYHGVPVQLSPLPTNCIDIQPTASCNLNGGSDITIRPAEPVGGAPARGSGDVNMSISCNRPVTATLTLQELNCTTPYKSGTTSAICNDGTMTISSPDWEWGTTKTGDSHTFRLHAEYEENRPMPGLHRWTYLITASYD